MKNEGKAEVAKRWKKSDKGRMITFSSCSQAEERPWLFQDSNYPSAIFDNTRFYLLNS